MNQEKPKRILVVKLSAIGDVLMATPASRVLRNAFPDSYIAWIVEPKSADIVKNNPYLDEVIVWEHPRGMFGRLADLFNLRRDLSKRRFDVVVDLQGLLKSAAVCLFSGAKRRVGFSDAAECAPLLYTEKYRPNGEEMAQQRNLDILRNIGVESADTAMHMPVRDEDRKYAAELIKEMGLEGETIVGFCPATTWVNKHWTPEGWTDVADLLGDRLGAKALIFGSKADIPLATKIQDAARHKPAIAAGRTTLKQAGALMEHCTAMIGVDTGLLHMAVALDRPAIGLFGASQWRCFLKKDNFIWVAKDFPCSPCRRHPTCGDVDCMRAITGEDVLIAVAPFLEPAK